MVAIAVQMPYLLKILALERAIAAEKSRSNPLEFICAKTYKTDKKAIEGYK